MGCVRASYVSFEIGDFTRSEALSLFHKNFVPKDNAKLQKVCVPLQLKFKKVLGMSQKIEVQCDYCGNKSYISSNRSGLEHIEFVCPKCGKYGLLSVYAIDLGHQCPADRQKE